MAITRNSALEQFSIKHVLVILLLNNVYTCDASILSLVESEILLLLEPYLNSTNFPINYAYTEEEIYNNTQDYLEGLNNEDIFLNGTQLIQKYGYDVEEHHVTTTDGYILALIRIPGKGRPIFLMHGIVSSFEDWLTIGPDRGLPYLLAAAGYDVWLGNARGNTFSKQNVNISSSDPEFWDFSWNEIGRLDLPAMIDYVLETTDYQNLTYVGHSQGTTAFFVLCSEKPEYNDKINFMVALSAVAWSQHMTNPFVQIAARYTEFLYALGSLLGLDDIAADSALKKIVVLAVCGDSVLSTLICENVEFLICGFDYPQIDFKQAPVIFNHVLAGSSLKQFVHYGQLVESGYFRNFDYGTTLNSEKYNSTVPPSYPVNNITVPVAIFYSYGDWLSSPIDVEVLRDQLQNVVDFHQISLLTFNHGDYLWAKDVKTLVYDRVLQLISENY